MLSSRRAPDWSRSDEAVRGRDSAAVHGAVSARARPERRLLTGDVRSWGSAEGEWGAAAMP
jgi:hypothetical protein